MITFTSKDSDKQLIIGGASALDPTASDELGVVGPFPRYSISREELTTEDGTYINSKFSITVTGTATLKSGTNQDMLKQGERQAAVQGEAIILAQLNRNQWPMHGNGLLQIAPYGGKGNKIKFNDSRITSIELPEQNESAGVQNQEYTIQFEAYEDTSASSNDNDPAGTGSIASPTYNLSNVAESWELVPAEDRYNYAGNKLAGAAVLDDLGAEIEAAADTPYTTFTLTHTLSATGLKKLHDSSTGLADDGAAWKQAAEYIGARLTNTKDPTEAIVTNTLNMKITKANPDAGTPGEPATINQTSNQFNPFQMDSEKTNLGYDLGDADSGAYKAYDHVRTVSSNVSAGSYSVTDTWVVAYGNDNQSATTDLEISVEGGVTEAVVVTLNGTVAGLSTKAAGAKQHDKYTNAKAAYDKMATSFKAAADSAYADFVETDPARTDGDLWVNPEGTVPKALKSTEFSKTLGINKVTGTITFSVSFNDAIVQHPSVIEDSIQVEDSGGTDVIAIIGVLLRAAGPVIQDMGTITEKRKTVTYTAKINRENRTNKPTFAEDMINEYAPFEMRKDNPDFDSNTNPNAPRTILIPKDDPDAPLQWVQTRSESWNKDTGDYTFTKEWAYN